MVKKSIYLIKRFKLNKHDLILDIGCNDGILLNQYPRNYRNLIGVEPSDAHEKIKNNSRKKKMQIDSL